MFRGGWRHGSVLVATALLCVAMVRVAPAASPGEAQGVVDALQRVLLEVMSDAERLGFRGRRDRIAPVIAKTFDMPYIARLVMGGHWSDLDPGQRSRLTDTLRALTVATYASRFDGFDGERFEVLEERELRQDRRLVRAEIRERDGDRVTLDYLLHSVDGDWRIVNVVADGVSDLSLKRAEYSSIMKSDGFDTLVTRLDGQISDFEANTGR